MSDDVKFVNFYKYCSSCKHKELKDYEDPCNECLDNPARDQTEKPIHWEEKD